MVRALHSFVTVSVIIMFSRLSHILHGRRMQDVDTIQLVARRRAVKAHTEKTPIPQIQIYWFQALQKHPGTTVRPLMKYKHCLCRDIDIVIDSRHVYKYSVQILKPSK